MTVYLDGKMKKMTLKELRKANYNVLINKGNGYSHIYSEAVPFNENFIRNNEIWCTEKPLGRVLGSSEVSFS